MSEFGTGLRESIYGWLHALATDLRAAFSVGISQENSGKPASEDDLDFEGWLHNDPMVTGNPANRYGDDSPGYLTSNGLGSLEIGAIED